MGESLRGVLELNLLFLVAGVALAWGLRGFRSLLDLVEMLPLALLLGLCTVTLLSTLVLVAGAGLPLATIGALVAGVSAAGAGAALVGRRGVARTLGSLPPLSAGTLVAAVCAIGAVAILVELVRVAGVMPLGGSDSWEFWVPKAKLIYFDGGIDNRLFPTLAGQSYPLLVPALLAMDFRFMGSAYAPELAVQYWILYAAFVFAVAALLRRLVPAWLAWLFVALTAVIPQLNERVLNAQADWALDILFALCALLAVGWLRTRERWQLWSFAITLAAVLATKREGQLLAACLGLGMLASSVGSRRRVWLPLIAAAAAAYAVNLPWRIWWESRHLPSDVPGGGLDLHGLLDHSSLIWPAFVQVVHPLFSPGMWLVLVPLALVAGAACLTLDGHARGTAILFLTTFVLSVAGFTWIGWSDPLGLVGSQNPLPRVVGSLVLFSTVYAPLLVQPLLARDASTVPVARARAGAVGSRLLARLGPTSRRPAASDRAATPGARLLAAGLLILAAVIVAAIIIAGVR